MICIQCMQVLKYTLSNITKYYHVLKEDTSMFLNILGIYTCFEPSNFSNPWVTMHYPGNYAANQIQHVSETTRPLSLEYLFARWSREVKEICSSYYSFIWICTKQQNLHQQQTKF